MTILPAEDYRSFQPLPPVAVERIIGLLEALLDRGGEEPLSTLAHRLRLSMDDLLSILDATKLLGFGEVSEADATVTDIGRDFAHATIGARRWLFREQVLERVTLITFMTHTLRASSNLEREADFFLDKLKASYPGVEPDRQFATAVEWGRYAELFEYSATTRHLRLLPVQG